MEDQNKIDLLESLNKILQIIHKNFKVLCIVLVLCCVFIVGNGIVKYRPQYTSQITFTVTKEINGYTYFRYNTEAVDKITQSFNYLLTSQPLRDKIEAELGKSYIPATLSLSKVPSTNMFTVKATSSSAQDAYDVIMAFNENYATFSRILLEDATLTLIEEAEVASIPSNTLSIPKLFIKGFIFGIGLNIAIIFLFYVTKRTINDHDDVKKNLNTHCIGVIPNVKQSKDKNITLMNYRNHYLFRESISNVCYEIESNIKNYGHKTFMITSCVPHEGKSTIASNLAIALSQRNYKVLLMDMDLRNPTLSKLLGIQNDVGIVETIVNHKLIDRVYATHPDYENLTMILGNQSSNEPTELLSQPYIKNMMTTLKKKFDIIIIDTPPIHLMDDALIIGQHIDETILVVKQDYLSSSQIVESMDQLANNNISILGCLINQAFSISLESGSNYGYGYGYGYGKNKEKSS